MRKNIKIASGQGFWGDLVDAPVYQVFEGEIDYLVMDYLAEVTMSILKKQQMRDPKLGYAKDIPALMKRILPECKKRGIKIITNGGGVNPVGCAEAVLQTAKELGVSVKVAVVTGDDLLDRLDELIAKGSTLNNMESGESIEGVKDKLLSANTYFGAFPIVEGLQAGADVVITGRTTDTGLTLAPMIYEFGWKKDEYDKLSAGTIAGHILECGMQASGGNFLGDWESVQNFEKPGFPICEAYPDGTFVITKHPGLGGKVSVATVSEQLLYEIGDPKQYITPDCVADFTSIKLEQEGPDRVKVHSITGAADTPFYKVSCAYADGYISFGSLTYSWPQALTKAKKAEEILRGRLKNLGLSFDEFRAEYVGYNACHGPLAEQLDEDNINEITMRVGVRGRDYKALERFGMEIAPLILTGPPAVTGFSGGRPKPQEVVAYWPALIKKDDVIPQVKIMEVQS